MYIIDEKYNYAFSFYFLCAFALLRPLISISWIAQVSLMGLRFTELFSILFSYVFIFVALLEIKRLKIDVVSLIILLFSFYCLLSILWGSNYKEISRLFLPFILFFIGKIAVNSFNQLKLLYSISVVGYILPVVLSFYIIGTGSAEKIIFWTGIKRFSGAYSDIHTLAHNMFLFLFFLICLRMIYDKLQYNPKIFIFFYYLLFSIALICLYKTYTRTVYFGFYILFMFYLIGDKKYKLLFFITLIVLLLSIFSTTVHKIMYDFFDVFYGKREIGYLGTGRLGTWNLIFRNFLDLSFPNKILGAGLSNIAISHNDFLSVLFGLGIVGLLLYGSILIQFFIDIFLSNIEFKFKYILFGILFSVTFMNLVSNSYISRVELSQNFFLIFGSFYSFKKNEDFTIK